MVKTKTPVRPNLSEPLEQYRRLIALLAARVRSVSGKFQTGAYLTGRPGSGKTHTVCRVLGECEADYVYLSGRITPAALYDEIESRPDSILVIDDIPLLFTNPRAAEILMAAVGGDPGVPRRVTYTVKGLRRVTEFSGGLVALSNRPLGRDPAGAALASRMATLEHEPTDEMLLAFMESEARKGIKDVPPAECLTVFGYVAEVCRAGDYRVDLRYFFKGVEDYRCVKAGACETDWRVLVRSSMRRVGANELPAVQVTRAGAKAAEYEVVRELHGRRLAGDVLESEWRQRTGKGLDSYYRRRRELRLR